MSREQLAALHAEIRALLADRPADVESLQVATVRAMVGAPDSASADDVRATLYRQVLAPSIVGALDAIARHFGSTAPSYDDLRCAAQARTADHPYAAECEGWLDDAVARCGLPQALADDLLAAIADDFHIFARG